MDPGVRKRQSEPQTRKCQQMPANASKSQQKPASRNASPVLGKQQAVGFLGAASRRPGRGAFFQRHVAGCPLAKASARESIIVIYLGCCRWTVVSAASQ